MPKYISIRDAFFFKYKTLTQAMSEAKKMGITNEIFNKLRVKQGIKNWTTCRKEYKINKNKSYIYKEKERIKYIEQKLQELQELQEDILHINNIDDINYIIEEEQERLALRHEHEYERILHKDKDKERKRKALDENNINDCEAHECKAPCEREVLEEDMYHLLVNDGI